MNHKHRKALPALLLSLALLLCACGEAAPAPEGSEEPLPAAETEATNSEAPAPAAGPELPEGAVLVSTVDELLAAIDSNTTIVLAEGEYDLSDAADYGAEGLKGPYSWELVYGGCELTISSVTDLRLIGQGEVSILAQPRYAQVLRFVDCWNLSLEGLTLGHTQAPGDCAAGVLALESCDDVSLDGCRLFGCGSMGISASNCKSVFVRSSRIDSCSRGAVEAAGCWDIRLEDCSLCDCGLSRKDPGGDLISVDHCRGFALVNCEISGNQVFTLLHSNWSDQAVMLGCKVEQNRIQSTMFLLEGRSVTIDKCSFQRRSGEAYYSSQNRLFAVDPNGDELISFDLDHMELARADYEGPKEIEAPELDRTQLPDGSWEVLVSNVDELLAAIAPNTRIVLAAGEYDLSRAVDYGGRGGEWYYWDDVFDGYALVLSNVTGLQIVGAGKQETTILAVPRYAAVLSFRGCADLSLSGFTAGHSPAPGYCNGDVLDFGSSSNLSIEGCGLFGCGVEGIYAWSCSGLSVRETEIYECSYSAATISACTDVSFDNCSIHDCDDGNDRIILIDGELSLDGKLIGSGILLFGPEGYRGLETPAW